MWVVIIQILQVLNTEKFIVIVSCPHVLDTSPRPGFSFSFGTQFIFGTLVISANYYICTYHSEENPDNVVYTWI